MIPQGRWLFGMALVLASGCATVLPEESSRASLPAAPLPSLQGSYHTVRRGETLWRIARSYGMDVRSLAAANRMSSNRLTVGQRLFLPLPAQSNHFLWPLRGRVAQSHAGGVDIAAPPGSLVRASRSGQVVAAVNHLSGWNRTVIVDHADGFLSVYAGLEQILISPGSVIRQGMPLGTVSARALHFEIREGTQPRSSLALLPSQ